MIIIMNCYEHKDQILRSDLMEVLRQPPFPGFYKTKDTVDLVILRESFHAQYGEDSISIHKFLEFLADITKSKAQHNSHGEGVGQVAYGFD